MHRLLCWRESKRRCLTPRWWLSSRSSTPTMFAPNPRSRSLLLVRECSQHYRHMLLAACARRLYAAVNVSSARLDAVVHSVDRLCRQLSDCTSRPPLSITPASCSVSSRASSRRAELVGGHSHSSDALQTHGMCEDLWNSVEHRTTQRMSSGD